MSNLKDKIKYATETLIDVAKDAISGEDILASNEEAITRLKTCNECEFFVQGREKIEYEVALDFENIISNSQSQNTTKGSIYKGRCNECGCMMKLKTELKAAKCPLGKW